MTLNQIFHQALNRISAKTWLTRPSILARRPAILPRPAFIKFPFGPQLPASEDVPTLPTGIGPLDRVLEIRGLPQGYMTELIGTEGQGGISVAAKIAAKFQLKQLPVTIIDMSGQFDPQLAAYCGLHAPELLIHLPQTAYDLITLVDKSRAQIGLVVINLGFVPQTFAGAKRGQLSLLLRRLYRMTAKSQSVFLYLTTIEEVDPFIHTNYPDGFVLSEVADIRLWLHDEGWLKQGEDVGGYRGTITVIKNAFAAQGKGANIRIKFSDPNLARLEEDFAF